MQVFYLSTLASSAAIADAFRKDPSFSAHAVQKFHHLLTDGLVRNGCRVTVLSTFYLPNVGMGYCRKAETVDGVTYQYIPSPNCKPVRMVWLTLVCFFRVLFWGLSHKRDKVLMADVLNVSACIGAVAAARTVGLRSVGIVTDLPQFQFGYIEKEKSDQTVGKSLPVKLNNSFLPHFSHYVFLTEQMNRYVNKKNKPYLVMEGLVDMDGNKVGQQMKRSKKVVLYAGGLVERYGLGWLVEGFIQANIPDSELWIYGSGPFASSIERSSQSFPNVIFKGIHPNEEVVEAERMATLLVNPRPSDEAFAQYSFPSKNMEYMVSGTPLLTTALPGMPKEYHPHVYLFDKGESAQGYAASLREILSLPEEELRQKGESARNWVLHYKNHVLQTSRILGLLEND